MQITAFLTRYLLIISIQVLIKQSVKVVIL